MLVDWPDLEHPRLINPFTLAEVTLPQAPFPYDIGSAMLTASLSSPDCFLLAFSCRFSNAILYCPTLGGGDPRWESAVCEELSVGSDDDGRINLLLMYVISFWDRQDGCHWKQRIRAFRLDPSTDEWVKVESLGGRTVFWTYDWLGAAAGVLKGREGCIRFADYDLTSLTIFSLKHGSNVVDDLPLPPVRHNRFRKWLSPFWVSPNRCFQ